MKRRLIPVFLILFVWLQCLAPLLHAHAAAEGHTGVHLPESTLAQVHEHRGVDLAGEQQGHVHAAIALASSLEPRQDQPWPDTPALLLGYLLVTGGASGQSQPPGPCRDRPQLRFSHLVAEACAPPSA